MANRNTGLEQVMELARQLPPLDKLRLIENLAPDLEVPLRNHAPVKRRSLRGLLKGVAISSEEIDRARREMWGNFPSEDIDAECRN